MDELRRRVKRGLELGLMSANVGGAFAVYLFLGFARYTDGDLRRGALFDTVPLFLTVLVVASVFAHLKSWWLMRPVDRWLQGELPLDDSVRRAALAQPFQQAASGLVTWVIGGAAFALASRTMLGESTADAVTIFDAAVFGGLFIAGCVYLLVERVFRPVFALVLAGGAPERASCLPAILGIRPRFILAWALGSGVPLFGVAVAPSVIEGSNWQMPIVVLAIMGLLAGVAITVATAGSVSDPLDELRHGLGRVEQGDLDVAVTVNDGGEVGLLQAGFNQMAEGLRERERLRELFGRHVGEQVAQLAIENGVDLAGEQTEASVLFVDLIGSTTLALDRPPTDVLAVCNQLFGTAVRVVNEEGGYVSRFEGDGALCVFGVPVPMRDHASGALRAARRLAADLDRQGIPAGVGVSSGVLVAGNIGTPERYEYTVIGDPVNEASRLTDAAKRLPGRVLASEAAIARADEEALHWQAGDEIALRGRGAPTLVFAPVPVSVPQSTLQ